MSRSASSGSWAFVLISAALSGPALGQPLDPAAARLLNALDSDLRLSVRYERGVNTRLGSLPVSIPAGTEVSMRVGFSPRGEASVLSSLELLPSQPLQLGPLTVSGLSLNDGALDVKVNHSLLHALGIGRDGVRIDRIVSAPDGTTIHLRPEGAGRLLRAIRVGPDGALQLPRPFGGRAGGWWTIRDLLGRPVRLKAALPKLPHWPPLASDVLALASKAPAAGSAGGLPRVPLGALGELLPDSVELRARVRNTSTTSPAPGPSPAAAARPRAVAGALSSGSQLILALFLKELAPAALSGDRGHVEALFQTFQSLDLWVHYGEVAFGTLAAQAALARFRDGLLKTSLLLAVGMALPELLQGTFDGRALAISFGALSLSSAAVHVGLRGLAGVQRLQHARVLGLGGAVSGWLFGVGKLAVVLYLSDRLSEEAERRWGALPGARRRVAEGARTWVRALEDPRATPGSVSAATEALLDAFAHHAEVQLGPLLQEQARAQARWSTALRRHRELEAVRGLPGVAATPGLRALLEARDGSLRAAGERLVADDAAQLGEELEVELDAHGARARALLSALYTADPARPALLRGLSLRAEGLIGRYLRDRTLRGRIARELADDRPGAQAQARELLLAGLELLEARGADPTLAAPIRRAIATQEQLARLDRSLASGLGTPAPSPGFVSGLPGGADSARGERAR